MAPHAVADRTRFRQILAEIAEKARERLPQAVNGRLESAVKLVLQGDVQPLDDGSIQVGSSDPTRYYRLVGTTCTCTDFVQEKAPQGWCKHRIAAGLQRRVQQVLASEAPPENADTNEKDVMVFSAPLPEAAASVNVRLLVGQHECQWTLRGHDEGEIFTRLQALLARKEVRPLPPKPAPRAQGRR
jgi:hypothetical protein